MQAPNVNVLLTPQDFHNLRAALTKVTPSNFEEMQVIVVLHNKLGQVIASVENAKIEQVIASRTPKKEQDEDVPAAD